MAQVLRTIILIVSTLIPIVNPLGSAPMFLALTSSGTPAERKILSWKVASNSFFLLLGSILIGTHILSFFGISVPIVQVGGGLIVISAGWAMLKREDDEERKEIERNAGGSLLLRKAFYPLTLPLTVGPGSIATAITLGANSPHSGGNSMALALIAAAVGALSARFLSFHLLRLCRPDSQATWTHSNERDDAAFGVPADMHRITDRLERHKLSHPHRDRLQLGRGYCSRSRNSLEHFQDRFWNNGE